MTGKARGKPAAKKTKIESDRNQSKDDKKKEMHPTRDTAFANDAIRSLESDSRMLTSANSQQQEYFHSVLDKIQSETLGRILYDELREVSSTSIHAQAQIALIGETGGGKSTMASTLLRYRKLIPAMGATGDACTAAPTKIMYNEEPDSFKLEFVYINQEELKELFDAAKTVIDSLEPTLRSSDSRLGRIKKISGWSDDDIMSKPFEDILAIDNVKNIITSAQPVTVHHTTEEQCCSELKQRMTAFSKQSGLHSALMKEAQVYVKAELLKYATLIDLPGSGDDDPARRERYIEYMKSSTALCIFTPAVRANSNACYQDLIKRAIGEFQYDGRLNRIVLVCTKVDNCDENEIHDDMDLPEVRAARRAKVIADGEYRAKIDAIEEDRKQLEDYIKKAHDCRLAAIEWQKRKVSLPKLKRPPKTPCSPIDDIIRPLLTAPLDAASCVIAKTKCTEEAARLAEICISLRSSINVQRYEAKESESRRDSLLLEYNRIAIAARSRYLKAKQIEKFMDLVVERLLAAAEADRATRGKYETVVPIGEIQAEDVPVFCTSAAEYKALAMPNPGDSKERTIKNKEDTDVPSLQRHLAITALRSRQNLLKELKLRLELAHTSLAEAISSRLDALPCDIKVADLNISDFRCRLRNFVYSVQAAVKAVRSGVDASYRRQFNIPFGQIEIQKVGIKSIKLILERCFNEVLGMVKELQSNFQKLTALVGINLASTIRMTDQLPRREQRLRQIIQNLTAKIENVHVKASESVASDVQKAYQRAYEEAYAISGPGTRQNMIDILFAALERDQVIKKSIEKLVSRLEQDLNRCKDQLDTELNKLAELIMADYNYAVQQSNGEPDAKTQAIKEDLRVGIAARGHGVTLACGAKRERTDDLEDEDAARMEDIVRQAADSSDENETDSKAEAFWI
ncbi:hypothetical protein LTS08_007965 [Lithohypha guttulata]|nr:hypothetical protein LTS08_007965 [Lithohypha guttulata]